MPIFCDLMQCIEFLLIVALAFVATETHYGTHYAIACDGCGVQREEGQELS
jgi:hypothetical protein